MERTQGTPGSPGPGTISPFVGRAAELEALRSVMPSAPGERRRIVLLAGEAGVGKSRLVREFAAGAEGSESLVLRGACDAVVRTPYGPFVEALDQLIGELEAAELHDAVGSGGGELGRLLPDLAARVGELPSPERADPDTERHRLHTAVAGLLTSVSRGRPTVLVLEDLHWADGPTLLLLRHLARTGADARLLVIATFRDTGPDRGGDLAEALADLRRDDDVVRVRLEGLSGAEVAELLGAAAGSERGDELGELAVAIHDLTGGNAFLVRELWRAMLETGMVELSANGVTVTRPLAELGTPESVREVVSQRLSRLEPGTAELLELAATAGPEFELEPIRAAAGLAEGDLLAAIEEAVASGMVEELSSQRLACRFTHELVRRALYDRLSRARRAELHLRVGEALESSRTGADRRVADLAHHFGAAAPFGGAERAIEYNLRAARQASESLDFDDAAARLRTAIEIGIEEPPERAEAHLELGEIYRRAGRTTESMDAFSSVARIARELGSSELLAAAAIGYEEAGWRPGIATAEAVELLEEALGALGESEGELRIGLLAGLARALTLLGDRERGAIVRGNSIALARRHGDRAVLARVLARSYWARGSTPLEEILAMVTEARDLAAEGGDAEIQADAMAWRTAIFVSLGDVGSARAEVASLHERAEATAQPFMHHVAEHYGSALALSDGRLAEAEAMAIRSNEWGGLMTGRDTSGTFGVQMFGIRREQGRLAELAPAVRILAGEEGRAGPWRPGLAAVLAELGMEEEARRELARVAGAGLDQFRETLWLSSLTYLADAAAALGDAEMAAILYPELEPLGGTNVMIGHLVAFYGSADRYLGTLAATLGERELAERHFETAMESNRAMGADTWVAHAAYQHARLLLGGDAGERERGDSLLREASSLAERIGLGGLRAKIAALGLAPGDAGLPDGLSPREGQILALVARGLSNRKIGEELTISEHTAANHVRSILRKSGCANRTEAASYAHRHGLAAA